LQVASSAGSRSSSTAKRAYSPVNYLIDGDDIVFRTGEGTRLDAARSGALVTFEVDDSAPPTTPAGA
jgi:uncharacterized protein